VSSISPGSISLFDIKQIFTRLVASVGDSSAGFVNGASDDDSTTSSVDATSYGDSNAGFVDISISEEVEERLNKHEQYLYISALDMMKEIIPTIM